MANKRITDVDFIDSLSGNESFFINKDSSIKQIGKDDIVFGVSNGGTGAKTASEARTNLGAASLEDLNALTGDLNALTEGLNNRTAVEDLLAEADVGASCRRFVICNSSTKNTPFSEGLTTLTSGLGIIAMSSAQYGTILYLPSGTRKLYMNAKNDGTWAGWKDCIELNYLPLTGGTITGNVMWLGDGYGRLFASDASTQLEHYTTKKDSNNRTILTIDNGENVKKSLSLYRHTNGTSNRYDIFGEYNRPSGTYTGNGSTNSRNIDIGGLDEICPAIIVRSDRGMAIVTASGVIGKNGETPTDLHATSAALENGILKLNTNSVILNESGTTYRYRRL